MSHGCDRDPGEHAWRAQGSIRRRCEACGRYPGCPRIQRNEFGVIQGPGSCVDTVPPHQGLGSEG